MRFKKFISALLLLTLVFSLYTVAFAEARSPSYDVIYNPGTEDSVSNLPTTETVESSTSYKVSEERPIREGYEFMHWMLEWAEGVDVSVSMNIDIAFVDPNPNPDELVLLSTNSLSSSRTMNFTTSEMEQSDKFSNVAFPGNYLTYTITVTNSGTIDATDYTLSATIPDELVAPKFSYKDGAPEGASIEGHRFTWKGNIPAKESIVFVYYSQIPYNAEAKTRYVANIELQDAKGNKVGNVDTSGATVEVTDDAFISIKKVLCNNHYGYTIPGATESYSVTIGNLGTKTASGYRLEDNIPEGLCLIEDSVTVETNSPQDNGKLTVTDEKIMWEGDIEPRTSLVVTYDVLVSSETLEGTTYTNTAVVYDSNNDIVAEKCLELPVVVKPFINIDPYLRSGSSNTSGDEPLSVSLSEDKLFIKIKLSNFGASAENYKLEVVHPEIAKRSCTYIECTFGDAQPIYPEGKGETLQLDFNLDAYEFGEIEYEVRLGFGDININYHDFWLPITVYDADGNIVAEKTIKLEVEVPKTWYCVRYRALNLDKSYGDFIHEDKVVENVLVGEVITERAIEIPGYIAIEPKEETITLKEEWFSYPDYPNYNKIIFYYLSEDVASDKPKVSIDPYVYNLRSRKYDEDMLLSDCWREDELIFDITLENEGIAWAENYTVRIENPDIFEQYEIGYNDGFTDVKLEDGILTATGGSCAFGNSAYVEYKAIIKSDVIAGIYPVTIKVFDDVNELVDEITINIEVKVIDEPIIYIASPFVRNERTKENTLKYEVINCLGGDTLYFGSAINNDGTPVENYKLEIIHPDIFVSSSYELVRSEKFDDVIIDSETGTITATGGCPFYNNTAYIAYNATIKSDAAAGTYEITMKVYDDNDEIVLEETYAIIKVQTQDPGED